MGLLLLVRALSFLDACSTWYLARCYVRCMKMYVQLRALPDDTEYRVVFFHPYISTMIRFLSSIPLEQVVILHKDSHKGARQNTTEEIKRPVFAVQKTNALTEASQWHHALSASRKQRMEVATRRGLRLY